MYANYPEQRPAPIAITTHASERAVDQRRRNKGYRRVGLQDEARPLVGKGAASAARSAVNFRRRGV